MPWAKLFLSGGLGATTPTPIPPISVGGWQLPLNNSGYCTNTTSAFAGLINQAFHCTFTNAIDALLEDDACTTPCRLVYGRSRFIDCENCENGKYSPGGPVPFPRGMKCSLCNGRGNISIEATEDIYLMVIADSKKFVTISRTVNANEEYVETMSRIEQLPKLMAAQHIVIDTANECVKPNRFQRCGSPEPCGLGRMEYVIIPWKRES